MARNLARHTTRSPRARQRAELDIRMTRHTDTDTKTGPGNPVVGLLVAWNTAQGQPVFMH
jgi:hypothetical protein